MDTLVLTDPASGEHATLKPGNLDEADGDEARAKRVGIEPVFAAGPAGSPDGGPAPTWMLGPLHYRSGRLCRNDATRAALTLGLSLPPAPVAGP